MTLRTLTSSQTSAPPMCHPERRAVRRPEAEGQFSNALGLLDEPSKLYLASLIERMRTPVDYMYVYILASDIGVTNNLYDRVVQHRMKLNRGFTTEKQCTKLVYFEIHDTPGEAIEREKQIKGWRREKKKRLIGSLNPPWIDLTLFLPRSDEDLDV